MTLELLAQSALEVAAAHHVFVTKQAGRCFGEDYQECVDKSIAAVAATAPAVESVLTGGPVHHQTLRQYGSKDPPKMHYTMAEDAFILEFVARGKQYFYQEDMEKHLLPKSLPRRL